MQDDTTKRPTVEDQELADMIANLNKPAQNSAPIGATPTPPPTPNPVGSPSSTTSPPPLPPQPTAPAPSQPAPIGSTPPQAPSGDSFNIPEPTPGLSPLPTAGTPIPDAPTQNPVEADNDKFEPPVSNLPPLGHKTPLPPLPGEEPDPDAGINEIGASLPEPPKPGKSVKVSSNSELNAIKQDALNKLRPLVDELNLSAQEKFDTLLLLIRSNDDKTLIPQAYEVADKIENETDRAAALLDVVKEIDFFENQ